MAWTLDGLLRAAGVRAEVRADARVADIVYDPAAVTAGALFCCIRGQRADGHDFHADVARAGASSLLVERFVDEDLPQARVASVRDALGPLADAFFGHPSREMDVVAVTGTNGKTTVTYLLESIARAAGLAPAVIGTVARRVAGRIEPADRSTPEAVDLQRLLREAADAGVALAAVEATSDGLVAGRLRGTRVAAAGFTNLTRDHLNTHGSMEAYFEAKALLFEDGYTERAAINADDVYGRRLLERVRGSLDVLTFGEDADISCAQTRIGRDGSEALLATPSGSLELRTRLVGRYNLSNCMCATALALHRDIGVDAIADGIAALNAVPGRLQAVDAGQPFLALVDYAHTPAALEQALLACRELASTPDEHRSGAGRVVVVFGCGGDRDRAKRPLMGEVATRLADLTIITSDNPRSEDPDAITAEIEAGARRGRGSFLTIVDRREAIAEAIGRALPGDVVLVAGKGHEQGQYFADRTIPFDDIAVTEELIGSAPCRS